MLAAAAEMCLRYHFYFKSHWHVSIVAVCPAWKSSQFTSSNHLKCLRTRQWSEFGFALDEVFHSYTRKDSLHVKMAALTICSSPRRTTLVWPRFWFHITGNGKCHISRGYCTVCIYICYEGSIYRNVMNLLLQTTTHLPFAAVRLLTSFCFALFAV